MNTAQQVAKQLLKTKAVTLSTNPPYTWTSGIKSPIYCDNRVLVSYTESYKIVVEGFRQIIEKNNIEFDIIGGTATAGIPWAAFLAYELNKPMVYIAHKAKVYGKKKQIEGDVGSGKRILIVEDLISTGGSVLRSIDICREEANANVVGALAIFTYEFAESAEGFAQKNVKLHTLSNFTTLVETAVDADYIQPSEKETVLEWSKNPKQWGGPANKITIQQKINNAISKNNSLVCVGLDSDFDKLPEYIKRMENPQFEFNKAIIDATYDLVCTYKPNSAFYEARGEQGIKELKMTCDYIKEKYPDIFIILDAKRADIGNTNLGYIKFAYDYLGTDAITVHPYLGSEAIKPFLDRTDKACIVLCRTSNPGAQEIQDLQCEQKPIYQIVAEKVANHWNNNNNCMMVIGATYPEELARVRQIAGEMTFLVPGIGVQGGDIEKTVKAGLNSTKTGMIINSSRGIIFADDSENFAQVARAETTKLREAINQYR